MPQVALPIAMVAGAGASASGGKKARKQADQISQQQLQLQQQQLGLSREQLALGRSAFTPARDYWLALMQGGQTARTAVGPYADLIGESADASRRSIMESAPRGGERNLALAQNETAEMRDISRLYAGQQPFAAQNLGQLSSAATGAGVGLFPQPAVGASLMNYASQQNQAQEGAMGFGRLLYNAINKRSGSGSSSSSASGGGMYGPANWAAVY